MIIKDHHCTCYWFGLLDARGGSGYRAGGAGTVLLEVGRHTAQSLYNAMIIIDHHSARNWFGLLDARGALN